MFSKAVLNRSKATVFQFARKCLSTPPTNGGLGNPGRNERADAARGAMAGFLKSIEEKRRQLPSDSASPSLWGVLSHDRHRPRTETTGRREPTNNRGGKSAVGPGKPQRAYNSRGPKRQFARTQTAGDRDGDGEGGGYRKRTPFGFEESEYGSERTGERRDFDDEEGDEPPSPEILDINFFDEEFFMKDYVNDLIREKNQQNLAFDEFLANPKQNKDFLKDEEEYIPPRYAKRRALQAARKRGDTEMLEEYEDMESDEESDELDEFMLTSFYESWKTEDGSYGAIVESPRADRVRVAKPRTMSQLCSFLKTPDVTHVLPATDEEGQKLVENAWTVISRNNYYTDADKRRLAEMIAKVHHKAMQYIPVFEKEIELDPVEVAIAELNDARGGTDHEKATRRVAIQRALAEGKQSELTYLKIENKIFRDSAYHSSFRKGADYIEEQKRLKKLRQEQETAVADTGGQIEWDADAVVDEDQL